MQPIVFLDFDDVLALHPRYNLEEVIRAFELGALDEFDDLWHSLFHYTAVANLMTLHDEFLPAYVITSSWSIFLNKQQISEVLCRSGLSFVVENLMDTWCTPRDEDSYRLSEIEAWLESAALPPDVSYVILDDELSGQSLRGSHFEESFVCCGASTGFTSSKLDIAIEILRTQLCWQGKR